MTKESIFELLDVAEAQLQGAYRHARFGEWGQSAQKLIRVHAALHDIAQRLDLNLDMESRNLPAEEIPHA